MDAFDDEPSAGGGYDHAFKVDLYDLDGVPRRIVVRQRNRFQYVSVSLDERRNGIEGTLVRFDDAPIHGYFHRHDPGWPKPGPVAERLDHVSANARVKYAIDEIGARYTLWEATVFERKGGELR